jgi:hypothetical protein
MTLGPCVEWQGARTDWGYGVKNIGNNKIRRVHRLEWERHNGPIPAGMFVCHACDNPPCYNIDHLFLGTPSDNTADMHAKGRGDFQRGKTHCPRGHPYDVMNTYVIPDGRRDCRACGRERKRRYKERKKRERAAANIAGTPVTP